MRISDWSSDVCSSDLLPALTPEAMKADLDTSMKRFEQEIGERPKLFAWPFGEWDTRSMAVVKAMGYDAAFGQQSGVAHAKHDLYWLPRFPMNEHYGRSEEHTSELQSLMRISYAVFCLKKKNKNCTI